MNVFSYSRRLAQGALLLCLSLVGANLQAQCGDFQSEPQPVTAPVDVTLNLTNGGAAVLDENVLLTLGFTKMAACSYEVSANSNFGALLPFPASFFCSDILFNPNVLYLRVNGAGGPSNVSGNFREIRITILDMVNPAFVAPLPDVAFTTSGDGITGDCVYTANGSLDINPFFDITDNCNISEVRYYIGANYPAGAYFSTLAGVDFPSGLTTVYVVIYDDSGNEGVDDYTVTVTDDEAPVTTCPTYLAASPLVIPPGAGLCSFYTGNGLPISFNPATYFTDNCPSNPLTFSYLFNSPPTPQPVFSTFSSTVSLVNNPADTTFSAGPGVIRVRFQARDAAGNTQRCTFHIQIADQQPPIFDAMTVPANITIGTDANAIPSLCFYDNYTHTTPDVNDNCSTIATYDYSVSGATTIGWTPYTELTSLVLDLNVGVNTIHYRATDGAALQATTSFTVTVIDNEAPVVSATSQYIYAPISATDCSKVITFTRPSIADLIGDCGVVTMQEVVVSGPDLGVMVPPAVPAFNTATGGGSVTVQFPAGITRVAYYWIDNTMNFDSVHYTFIVQDTVKPIAKCKDLSIALNTQGKAYVTAANANNGSTDNCPLGVSLSVSVVSSGTSISTDSLYFDCGELGPNFFKLTITDASGNSSSKNCTATILDNTAPTAICPADIFVNAGTSTSLNPCAAKPTVTLSQYADNCPLTSMDVSWTTTGAGASPSSGTGNVLSGVVFSKGSTKVIFTVSDGIQSSVCDVDVIVSDVNAPTPDNPATMAIETCPPNITVNANQTPGCSYRKPPAAMCIQDAVTPANQWCGSVTFYDNCDATAVVSALASLSQTYNLGPNTITLTQTDATGNVGTCSFTITVKDGIKPTALCKTTVPVSLSATPLTVSAAQVDNGSTDNCTLITPANLSIALTAGGAVPGITSSTCNDLNVTLTVTDFDGNTATCTSVIDVTDDVKPICSAQNITRTLSATNPGSVTVNASEINSGSSDNCSAPGVLTFTMSTTSNGTYTPSLTFGCSNTGANTVFLKVADANVPGNLSLPCQATITVQDITPPSVVFSPGNITVNCDVVTPNVTAYVATLSDATFADNCTVSTVNETFTTTPGSCPNRYTINRKWVATDAAGLMVMAQQAVTVQDTTKPTVTLPSDVTINLSSSTTCTPSASYQPVTATDNCGSVTTTWTIDYAGVKPDTIGNGLIATSVSGFTIGLNTITFKVTDQCGNTTTKTMKVTVVDNVVPVFSSYYQPTTTTSYCNQIQPLFTFNNTPGLCGYTFQWVRPWTGDITDCSTITFAAESITATTPVGPQILSANFPWDQTNPLTQNVPVSLGLPVGTTTFTYKVTDAANNMQTCSFNVKVNDTQTPTLSGPTTAILNSICPTQTIGDYTGLVSATDNCGQNIAMPLTQVPAANTQISALTFISPNSPVANPYDGSQFIVTITANDGTNVSLPRNITVTLDDNTAPVPTQNTLADANSNCGYIILITPTAFPNCIAGSLIYGTPGGVSATAETFNGANITSYRVTLPNGSSCQTYFVTWSYSDGNGNLATQLQKVTLCPDIIAPTAVCKNATLTLSPTTATLTTADINNGSFDTDNCNPFTLSLSKTAFTCADISPNNTGFTTVTLTATSTNNSSLFTTCTAQVKVLDNIAPTIEAMSVPANITVDTCSTGYVLPVAATVTATDNCFATVSFVQTSTQGTTGITKYNFVVTRTWTAKDVFGNTSSAVQTITVRDVKKPEFTTPSAASLMFSTLPVTVNCSANVKFNVAAFVSDCAPDAELSVVANPAYFSLTDSTEVLTVGSHTVTFTVTDPSGNTATSSITIVVKDATKPIASCINGISLALNANGQAIVTSGLINNQSSDNCGSVTLQVQELEVINGDTIGAPANQLIFDCGDADNDTEYPIILWVKDASGNFNFCETYVVIQDNVAPTITCPANVTVECSNSATAFLPATLGNPSVTDNCPADVTTTYSDAPVTPGYACGDKVRTFKAVDLSGNTATCLQVINVIDTKPPVFNTLPQNDTISCDDPLVVAPILKATDNCTPADSILISLLQVKSDSVGVCGKYSYKVTRTWTAKDKCGNVTIHTQVVKVEDKTGPKFLGMPDTILVLTANFPPSTNCTAPVALNAEQYFNDCATLNESTINSIVFKPVLVPAIVPVKLNVSGDYPVGNTKIIFTVTDPCANVGKDSVVVKVVDNSAPVVICNNSVEIALSNNGLATLAASDVNLNSFDNCGIATLVLSKTQFDCEDLGINNVTLTVTDIHGNSNSCTVGIEVTAGSNTGFTMTTANVAPTYFGGANGSASVTVTGGSNSFGYLWSNAATTSAITGVAAGSYTVTVTDLFTGCKQVVTIVLPDGPIASFTVGAATGAQNTIVKVPVNVDNFQEISGFTYTMDVPNATVGSIVTPVAVTDINAGLGSGLQVSINGNTLSVLYLNSQGANVDLPNGALLFNLCIQLSGAPLGTTSAVNITGSPVQFTVLRTTINGPITIPANQVSGSVQITQGLNAYDVLGDIYPWQNPAVGVPNVNVNLTGPAAPLSFTTTVTGEYPFNNILANTNTVTGAAKSQAGNSKIDIIDQGLLLKHIFATATSPSPLTSPYQRVAADVNFDGQINIIDFALIQRLLLGTVQHLEGAAAKDWVFIPKSYSFPANTTTPFPSPVYPAITAFPQTILHTPLFQDELDDDFVGVRMGDLNGDAPLNLQQSESEERNGGTLKLRLEDRTIKAGETVNLAFKAKDFTNRYGYQLTLSFDPNVLELQNIETGAVPGLDADGNFGTTLLSDGLLSTAWVSLDQASINDDETMFTLVFKATDNINLLSQILHISSDIVAPMAINENGAVDDVALEFTSTVSGTQTTLNTEYVLYQNQPNPFRSSSAIGFRLPAAERCVVKVFASNGRLVKTFIGNYEKGYNNIQVRNSDLGGAGVYYYELSTASFSDRKKMILID